MHLGFDTARVESIRKSSPMSEMPESEIVEVNSPAGIDHELRDPDGNTVGLIPPSLRRRRYDQRPVPIRHIALYTPNPQTHG